MTYHYNSGSSLKAKMIDSFDMHLALKILHVQGHSSNSSVTDLHNTVYWEISMSKNS